jgi:lysophospholipase L1-like esterase
MLRVALVGDSHLTDVSQRPVTKLGPRLRSAGFEVMTLARGGLDTRQALRHAAPNDVDWIVYSFGTNDSAPWKQVPPHEYERNYATLLSMGAGTGQLVLGPPPVSDRQIGRLNNLVREYSDIAARVAQDHGADFVALLEHLTELDLADDGVHLNDSAYTTIAELVTDILRPTTD